MNLIHGNGKALVSLLGNRTVGHGAGLEAGDNRIHALHFLQRNPLLRIFKIQKRADLAVIVLAVHKLRIFFEKLIAAFSRGLLQQMNRPRIVQMLLAGTALLVKPEALQRRRRLEAKRIERRRVQKLHLLLDFLQADAADPADRICEIFINHFPADADGLENLGAHIGLNRGDSHLGGCLHDAADHRLIVIVHRRVIILVQDPLVDQLLDAFLRQIRIDGAGPVAQQRREMMHLARLSGLQNDGDAGPLLRPHQMLLQSGYRQQRRDRHMILVHSPVGQNENVHSVPVGPVRLHEQAVDRAFQAGIFIIGDRKHFHLEAVFFHGLDFQKVCIGQNRIVDAHHTAVLRLLLQQIPVLADKDAGGGDDLLTDRVNRRIRYLGKQLFEIIEQRLVMIGKRRQRDVDAHGGSGLRAVGRHMHDRIPDILIAVAERLLQPHALLRRMLLDPLVGDLQLRQADQIVIEPLPVRPASRIALF